MSRSFAASLVASIVLAAVAGQGASGGGGAAGLPPGWTHISVNVILRGVRHTLVYDRGRVIAVAASSLTLRERDGTVWVIDVSPSARITINGQPAALAQVRRRETATTLSIDGAPATKVGVQASRALALGA